MQNSTINVVLPHKEKKTHLKFPCIRFKSYKIVHVAPFESFKFYLSTVLSTQFKTKTLLN